MSRSDQTGEETLYIRLEEPMLRIPKELATSLNSTEDISGWLDEELKAWSWLADSDAKIPAKDTRFAVLTEFAELRDRAAAGDPSDESEVKSELLRIYRSGRMIWSRSRRGRAIRSESTKDARFAAATLAFLIGTLSSPEVEEDYRAICWGILLRKGISRNSIAKTVSDLEELGESWQERFSERFRDLDAHQDEYRLLVDQLKERKDYVLDELSSLENAQRLKMESISSELADVRKQGIEILRKLEAELERRLEEKENELEGLRSSFLGKLNLKAPSEFWSEKQKSHAESSKRYLIVSLVGAPLVAAGLAYSAWFFLGSGSSLDVRGVGVFLVLSAMGFWFLRVVVKLYMAHAFLETDVRERIVLVKTYWSLLDKNLELEKEEKLIVMQSLFRPASVSLHSEERESFTALELLGVLARGSK